MIMKHILCMLLLLCSMSETQAKERVVESSAKKAPVWYDGTAEESIITSSISDDSIDDAKRRAMEQVKIKIIESVAQNINYTTLSKIEQKSGDESKFVDEFKSALMVNAAKLPFLSGISESKIEESYWAIHEDKESKKRKYIYSIKYPLKRSEMEKLIRTFEKSDREKAQEMEMLEEGYHNLANVDYIGDAIAKCGELEAYFFDSGRRAQVASLKSRYQSLYSRISVATQYEELGIAYVVLKIGDREIGASQPPMAKYDKSVITNFKVATKDGGFEVSYDPKFCEKNLPYVITLSFTVGGRRIAHEVTFTRSNDMEVSIKPQGTVTLTAQEVAENKSITNVQIALDLAIKGGVAARGVTIDVVTLKVPTLKDEIYCNKFTTKSSGSNTLSLLGISETTIALTGEKTGGVIKILEGEISGYYGDKRVPFKSNFKLPFGCNW